MPDSDATTMLSSALGHSSPRSAAHESQPSAKLETDESRHSRILTNESDAEITASAGLCVASRTMT